MALPEQFRWVYNGIAFLSSRDPDHAQDENAIGFNGRDTEFGNSIAARPYEQWTPKMLTAAYKMLRTYKHTQLPMAGIDYDTMPVPTLENLIEAVPAAKPMFPRTVGINDKAITLAWSLRDPDFAKIKDAVKLDLLARWDTVRYVWYIERSRVAAFGKLLEIVQRFNFQIDEDTMAEIASIVAKNAELIAKAEADAKAETALRAVALVESEATDADLPPVKGLGSGDLRLRPFQKAGIKYALARKRTWIADEMGLGKTVQAIGTWHYANAYPVIVVCPASLKLNWEREINRWLPGRKVNIVNGRQPTARADINVVNYDILGKHLEALIALRPQTVVFDESHYAKNPKAKRTKAAITLAKDVEYRLLLTGTAATNRPSELPSQLTIIDRIKEFGGSWAFLKRYCRPEYNGFGTTFVGADNTLELNKLLRERCYVRRMKLDVLKELPPKQAPVSLPVEITTRAEYQKAEADLIKYLQEGARTTRQFMASIAHLSDDEKKAAIHQHRWSRAESARRAQHLVRIETLKQISARGKLDAAFEWIDNFLESGEKLVVVGTHREITAAIIERYNAPSITGDSTPKSVEDGKARFQTDPDTKVIVLQIRAGGVGHTLTAASNVLFLELGWTPGEHMQAEDRLHRIGQEALVTPWYMLGLNTIDIDIAELIEAKRATLTEVLDGKKADPSKSILGDLMKRILKRADSDDVADDEAAYAESDESYMQHDPLRINEGR
jgi:SNF2 family DNA or RNA helicase